jgi:hypothetical protein
MEVYPLGLVIDSIRGGNTFTLRIIIISSVRPVTFSMQRMGRAVPGSSRVRSRVQ